jgi:hypothetical protein
LNEESRNGNLSSQNASAQKIATQNPNEPPTSEMHVSGSED